MIEVRKENYKHYRSLFNKIDCYLGVIGVLDGICNGAIYSDDEKDPKVAIMFTEDGYYLAGDFSNSFQRNKISAFTQTEQFPEYAGFLFESKHLKVMKELFANQLYQISKRNDYELMKDDFEIISDSNTKQVKITPKNLYDYKDYQNFKTLEDGCNFFWGEYQEREKMSFAMVLLDGKAIVSKCIICQESISENSCELDVETMLEYRGKGLGLTVVNATIAEAIKQGYEKFIWNCDQDNHASRKIAEKLKFTKIGESYLALFDKKL